MTDKPKILVVDDNSGNKLLLQYSLDGFFEVDFASNGLSAINKFIQGKYDLILMDIHMPELDGIETTRRIRQLEVGHRTPIFALTSNMFREQKLKCIEAGMDDYIMKPIHTKALIDRINNYLKSSMIS
jgi:two-component system, sensor histidine kinase and response regulator